MILTAASVSDLSNALTWWERGEYFFSFVVAVACFGEYVADFMPKWYKTGDAKCDEKRKESLSKLSTLVLIAALVFELVCVVRSNALAGQVIGSINDLATSAAGQSKVALDNAGKAQTLAQGASDTAKPAKATADAAKAEADQSQAKIAAADRRADLLNTQIAATQRAFSARDLPDRDGLIEQLKQFRGKTVSVRSYMALGDVDGYRVCQMVLDLARNAGMNPIDECATLSPSILPATGIRVCGPNDNEMLSLSRALGQIDIGGTCPFGSVPHSPNLTISVGAKALIAIGETFQTRAAEREAAAARRKASKPKAKR